MYDPNTGRDDGTDDPGAGAGDDWGHFYDHPGEPSPITLDDVKGLYARYYPGYTPSAAELQGHVGHPGGLQALSKFFEEQSKGYVQPPATGGGGGTTGGGAGGGPTGGLSPFGQPFVPPANLNLGGQPGLEFIPGAPQFPNIPRWEAPTAAEAAAEPGYRFAFDEGQHALENGAAARGTLNDSSTAKGLIDYGQNAATQQYGNVWNRKMQGYQSDVNTQYLDPFAAKLHIWDTTAAAGQHQNDLLQQTGWNKWLQDWNIFRDQRDSTFNKLFTYAGA